MKNRNCLTREKRQELYQRFRDAQGKLPSKGRTTLFFSAYPELDTKEGLALFYNMTHKKAWNEDYVKRIEILAKHIELAKARARDEWDFVGDIE